MNYRTCWILITSVGLLGGCVPSIKSVTPTGKKPLESVMIEGTARGGALEGPDHAVVHVDGGPVGTPLFSYPKPEVFIPVQQAYGQKTDATVKIGARNSAGAGNNVIYAAANVPVNAPPVSVDTISAPAPMQFTNEFTVTISGGGIFPGARNASLAHPHAGPPDVQAVPVGTPTNGANITATKVVFLTDNSIQAFFPDTMPHGLYRIYVKNDDRYGGQSGTSKVTFEWK